MPRLHEKLALQPPSGRIFKERPEFHFVRFQDAKYATTEADLWKEFADAEWKWTNPGRYAGSGLNCGYYYSCSSEAAVSEMDFYNKGAEWQGKKARMTIRSLYNGVFNLTEPDSVAFVFDRLLEFPYRRRSFRLALLASLTVGGNLFTDYIGCWAYHKGFAGVMFLSARALAPHRTDFDPSSLQGSNWGQYWSAMADEFDYYVMESLKNTVATRPQKYLNVVFFNGPILLSRISSYSVVHPNGETLEGANPHFEKQPDHILKELGFANTELLKCLSLERLHALQARVDAVCKDVQEMVKNHVSNQHFGSWMEENVLA